MTAPARSDAGAGSSRLPGRRVLPGLLAAVLLQASCTTLAARHPPPTVADQAIANRVYTALDADPVYFYRHVDVRVDQGVAALSGYVWSADALYRARDIARGIPGVTRVVTSDLELEREGLNSGHAR